MTAAGMDGTTVTGANADLNDPISWALAQMDTPPADITLVTDADLAGVSGEDVYELIDLAELRTLESVSGNLALVDVAVGPRRESLSQLANQVETQIARLQKKIQSMYGITGASISSGVISLGFQETYDD